jgi:hypothetical protein
MCTLYSGLRLAVGGRAVAGREDFAHGPGSL